MVIEQQAPPIQRTIEGLTAQQRDLLEDRYRRLLPVLYRLLHRSDIDARNRTWPGSKPKGNAATKYLSPKEARLAKKNITTYAVHHNEHVDQLWQLFRAYCRYGPIGLLEAFPADATVLVPDELQAFTDFHRLARHPRADAGMHIRSLLDYYADELGIESLPAFVARYAWATDRKLERWFTAESDTTEHVSRTHRRIVLGQPFPHKCWRTHVVPLPITPQSSRRNPTTVNLWLIWMTDEHTGALMGYHICAAKPTARDLALTLRWSIWHPGAPWWPTRGAPEILMAPQHLMNVDHATTRALTYLHTKLRVDESWHDTTLTPNTMACPGWPDDFADWISHLTQRAAHLRGSQQRTLNDVTTLTAEYICEALLRGMEARTTPTALQKEDSSLPWSTGIGATLLLPSAGMLPVRSGQVEVWGVPYALSLNDTSDIQYVDVRYDPYDARRVYTIHDTAHVTVATAVAFEHQTSWEELVDTLDVL